MQDFFHAMDFKVLLIKDSIGMSTCEIYENTLFNNSVVAMKFTMVVWMEMYIFCECECELF